MPDKDKCPLGLCDGTGVTMYEDNTYSECACRKAMHLQNYIESAMIPEGYRNKKFSDFAPATAEQEVVLKELQAYVNDWEARKATGNGISLISKSTRLGKSHLACAVAHAIIAKHQRSILDDVIVFVNVTNWIDEWRTFFARFPKDDETYDPDEKRKCIEALYKLDTRMMNCDLLVLDDIGEVPGTPWVNSKLYSFVEWRTSRNKPIMITSNHPWDVMSKKYGDDGVRIVDRLKEKSAMNTYFMAMPLVNKKTKKK